jgi:YD repeat-containing protein
MNVFYVFTALLIPFCAQSSQFFESYAAAKSACDNQIVEWYSGQKYNGYGALYADCNNAYIGSQPYWAARINTQVFLFGVAYKYYYGSVPSGFAWDPLTDTFKLFSVYNLPPKTLGPPCDKVGNPCDASTGNKYQAETDFENNTIGLSVIRHYNSGASNVNGASGFGWSHQLAPSLEILTGKIFIHQADGRAEWFTVSNSLWQGDADSLLRLTQDASGYTLADQLGAVERYDTAGRIVSRTEANGRTTTYGYDSSQRLATVTGPFGHSLQLAYDTANRISSVTYPDGLISQYQYDIQGNLSKVIYQDGSFKLYHYENTTFPHVLTGITDENGSRYATWTYDNQGRANSSKHAGGVEQVTLSYNGDGSTDVVDSFNASRHYTFQTILNVQKLTSISQPADAGSVAATRTQSHDANGNIASRTDFNGNLSCYAYDLSRNLETTRVEGLASGSSCPANLSAFTPVANSTARKIITLWHANYHLPTQIDQAGQRLSFTYDAAGNLLSKTITDTASQQSRSWSYTYNSLGQVLTANGPRTDVNDITTYSYYTDTTATHHVGDLWKVTNALSHVTTFNAYDADGRPLNITDANGLVTNLNYDARGRLIAKSVGGELTSYQYDAVGNLIKTTQPSGVAIRYSYDAAHRLTDIQDDAGNSIHYTLDTMGNRIHEDVVDPAGHLISALSRAVDALNRVQNVSGGQ